MSIRTFYFLLLIILWLFDFQIFKFSNKPKSAGTGEQSGFFVIPIEVVEADVGVSEAEVVIGSIVVGFKDDVNPVEVVVVVDENSHLTCFSRLQKPLVWSKKKPCGHERIISLLFTHLVLIYWYIMFIKEIFKIIPVTSKT